MKFLILFFLASCATSQAIFVQKQLSNPKHLVTEFIDAIELSEQQKEQTFSYIVHYNLKKIEGKAPFSMHFTALDKDLKELKLERVLTKKSGYEIFEFSKKKDKIFTYKIEINANDTTRMCEYLHTHWTRVIKLDKVCLSTKSLSQSQDRDL